MSTRFARCGEQDRRAELFLIVARPELMSTQINSLVLSEDCVAGRFGAGLDRVSVVTLDESWRLEREFDETGLCCSVSGNAALGE